MTESQAVPVQILLVEDSPGDVSLTREALKSARVANDLNVVEDGESALRYLRAEGEHGGAKAANLVLHGGCSAIVWRLAPPPVGVRR